MFGKQKCDGCSKEVYGYIRRKGKIICYDRNDKKGAITSAKQDRQFMKTLR